MGDDVDRAAALLERLVSDAEFRARFLADPAATCREHELPELADELADGGKALQTLDLRESKSSLAGVLMAAAAEGVGVFELVGQIGPMLSREAAQVVDRAMTLSGLDAIKGALVQGPPHSPQAAVASAQALTGAPPAPGAAAAAAPAQAVPAAIDAAAATPGVPAVDAPGGGAPAQPGAGQADQSPGWPSAGDDGQAGAAPPADAVDSPNAGAVAAAAEAAGSGAGAGKASAAAQALLDNPHLSLTPVARQDLASGAVDPRVVAVLGKLTKDHDVGISVIKSGHDKFVGGSCCAISNHFHGRGIDISSIDGKPVNADNVGARDVAGMIGDLDPSIRPTEIGTPWRISGAGYFTDAGHQDHLHLAFDDPMPKGLKLPADADVPAASVASAASDAGASAAAGQVTGTFRAAAGKGDGPRNTVQFLNVAEPKPVKAAAAGVDASQAADSGAPPAGGGPAPPAQVKQWIAEAMKILQDNGVDASKMSESDIWTIIQHESGGRPDAINDWDSNAAAGIPSKGLMQTIDPTFNAHKLPGHDDIYNPVDNIIAGVRYSISRYGSVSNVPGIVSVRAGGAYRGY